MKSKHIFRLISSVLLLVLAFSVFSFPSAKVEVSAATVSDSKSRKMEQEIQEIQEKQKQAKEKLAQLIDSSADLSEQKAAVEEEIKLKEDEIAKYEELCAELDRQISVKTVEIDEKTDEWNDKFEKFKKRLVVAYEEKHQGYTAMLLSGGELSKYYRDSEMLKVMLENDKKVMKELNDKKEELMGIKDSLLTDSEKAEIYKNNLNAAKYELDNKKKELNSLIYKIQTQQKDVERQIAAQQADLEKRNKELEKYLKDLAARGGTFTQGKLSWPLYAGESNRYNWISSPFGPRTYLSWGRWVTDNHYGIDICVQTGTPIHAAGDGTVVKAVYNGGSYGNYVLIDHGGGVATLYAHNNSLTVKEGDRVTRGQVIAMSGATGNVTGPHLHFEYRINGAVVDPLQQGRVSMPVPLKYV